MKNGLHIFFQERKSRNNCCVFNCSNNPSKRPELAFHRFPTNPSIRQKWIDAIKREHWQPSSYTVVCSEHFTVDSYRRPPGLKERPLLKRGIIPNRFNSYPAHLQPATEKRRRLLTRTASAEPEVETDASQLIEETPDPNAESPITSHGESPSTAMTPSRPWSRPVGRPIQSPSIRIRYKFQIALQLNESRPIH